MAQAKETASKDTQPAKDEGRAMPAGDGPIEFRPRKGLHLAKAGRVVKEAWIGRILGRSVRVYRGAQESSLPLAVRAAVDESGIEIGVITLEELGLRPRETGIVNLTQQQQQG